MSVNKICVEVILDGIRWLSAVISSTKITFFLINSCTDETCYAPLRFFMFHKAVIKKDGL